MELTSICLGANNGIKFRVPGPTHHARWMSKALYCLKIYLFREQFKLTEYEENSLASICAFIIRFYVKLWFNCTNPSKAPLQDLSFIKEIHEYRNFNKQISEIAIKKFCKHLWYLSEECIALTLFDDDVSYAMKQNIVEKIKNIDNCDKETENLKRVHVRSSEINEFIRKELHDFVTANTIDFFGRFGISPQFLQVDPLYWRDTETYQKAKDIVINIKVVNDTAERGVKLMEEYNRILTNDEQEKQYLLQVVTDYKKQFDSHNKSSLIRS